MGRLDVRIRTRTCYRVSTAIEIQVCEALLEDDKTAEPMERLQDYTNHGASCGFALNPKVTLDFLPWERIFQAQRGVVCLPSTKHPGRRPWPSPEEFFT